MPNRHYLAWRLISLVAKRSFLVTGKAISLPRKSTCQIGLLDNRFGGYWDYIIISHDRLSTTSYPAFREAYLAYAFRSWALHTLTVENNTKDRKRQMKKFLLNNRIGS